MTKETLHRLNIFNVSTISGTEELNELQSDDFNIDNFLHYPILVKEDGTVWKHANLYLLSKLKNYIQPSHQTLDAIASDLKLFYVYCIENSINYLSAPRRVLRPTYLYREYLQNLLSKGKISANTLKRRISTVIGFYKYLKDVEKIYFKFPLWESGIASISYESDYGGVQYKEVETKDLLKVPSTTNIDSLDDAIIDGGRLHPLEADMQYSLLKSLKDIGNVEMTFGFLIALTTGARMQTVFTLRAKHFKNNPSKDDKEMRIKVGFGTGCDMKNGKNHILLMPTWLYIQIKTYLKSPRYLKRRDKSKHIFDSHEQQYVFLTNRGTPYYVAKDDNYKKLYRNPASGGAVRQFIAGQLKSKLREHGTKLDFCFHDLRATFGMNLFDNLKKLVDSKEVSLTYILTYIKDRMGHLSIRTTEQYLNFRNSHKIKKQIQDDFEEFMEGILDV